MSAPLQPPGRSGARLGFAAVLLALLALGAGLEYPDFKTAFGQARVYFEGPDDYMRTYRARQIADGAALRVRFTPEIDAPHGAELHWTAPMDYLLAGAGLAFGRLAGRPDPFGAVAAIVPLGLGAIYLLYMAGVMRRGFGTGPALLAAAMIVLSPSWHRVFRLGHPDHHCLLALFLLAAVGAWIPRVRPDGSPGEPRRAAAACSGLAIGAAIWVSVEAMVFWAVMAASLWAVCAFGPAEQRRTWARARLVWNLSALFAVAAGWLFENWPDLGAVAADKISLVHVLAMVLGLLAPGGAAAKASRSGAADGAAHGEVKHRRVPCQAHRCIIFLAAVAALAAGVFLGRGRVFEHVSQPEFSRWIGYLMEFQPLYTEAGSEWSLRPLHSLTGFMPYGLPVLLVFFLRCRQAPPAVKYMLAVLAPAITLLAIRQLRWIDHYNLAVMPVAVIGACELARSMSRGAREPQALISAAVLALLAYPAIRTTLFYGTQEARQSAAYLGRTDFVAQRIVASEAEHPNLDPNRRAILCEDGEGPALLYWTGLPVVATPYHRALDGLLEMARFFTDRDPARARERLDDLGVRYVVMPPRAHEQLMQFEELAFGRLRSFDPPRRSIDESGRETLKLSYRPAEVAQTMAYRLVMEPRVQVIPGLELLAEINEGAKTTEGLPMKTGLLYLVHDSAPPSSRSDQ